MAKKLNFKMQFIFPVTLITVFSIMVVALFLSYEAKERERTRVGSEIKAHIESLQEILSVTSVLMQDQAMSGIALIKHQLKDLGPVKKGAVVRLDGPTVSDVPDLDVGGKSQAHSSSIVDLVSELDKSTATIFTKKGDTFVRIATTVKRDDGTRAIGTELDTGNKAYAALQAGKPFYGVVDILGKPYYTGYEPLFDPAGEVVGAIYVGYPAKLNSIQSVVETTHILQSGYVVITDSSDRVVFQPSWAPKLAQPQDSVAWNSVDVAIPEWGFKISARYLVAEQNAPAVQISVTILVAGVLLAVLISAILYTVLERKVVRLLGGDPQHATDCMRMIANGNLGVEISTDSKNNDSLMASLKIMQMKLKNIVTTIQENALTLNDQIQSFESISQQYAEHKSEALLASLVKTVQKVQRTADILNKSVTRFKS